MGEFEFEKCQAPGEMIRWTVEGKVILKKYEKQCQCIHQHFETFDQKSKHNYIHNLKQVECWCKYCWGYICKINY